MTTEAAAVKREPQVAVVPLNAIDIQDVASSAATFDAWLQSASGGVVTLDRIKNVAGALPVVGNIMALVDALGDIVTLSNAQKRDLLAWASLGINLIGVLPLPPAMAAARMTLRPTLFLVRQEMKASSRMLLSTSVIEVLVGHLNESIIGTHYDYDERGNQIQRWHNGQRSDLQWDLFDRLVHFEDPRLSVDFAYDALGRRLHKNSRAHYKQRPEAGSLWNRNEHARKQRELGCGFTLYGWDGDNLAWESNPAQSEGEPGRTVHYVFEPDTFVPIAQAVRHAPIDLIGLPDYSGEYSLDEDPVWNLKVTALPFDALAWYQCDHLGTPQELTDSRGNMAWTAQYKAWGQVTEQRSEWARQHGVMNPIRFQGQYHDHETGLHYNRYRYYDPSVGRFINQDPIGLAGGLNAYEYAPNPVQWIDPLGLARIPKSVKTKVAIENKQFHGVESCEKCLITVVPGQKSQRGVTPPPNERQFDHIQPDSLGGANDEGNTQILCRRCNREASDSIKPDYKTINRLGGSPP
jgi:RHS repeat-associated protein